MFSLPTVRVTRSGNPRNQSKARPRLASPWSQFEISVVVIVISRRLACFGRRAHLIVALVGKEDATQLRDVSIGVVGIHDALVLDQRSAQPPERVVREFGNDFSVRAPRGSRHTCRASVEVSRLLRRHPMYKRSVPGNQFHR